VIEYLPSAMIWFLWLTGTATFYWFLDDHMKIRGWKIVAAIVFWPLTFWVAMMFVAVKTVSRKFVGDRP